MNADTTNVSGVNLSSLLFVEKVCWCFLKGALIPRDNSDFLPFDNKLINCIYLLSIVVWGDSFSFFFFLNQGIF